MIDGQRPSCWDHRLVMAYLEQAAAIHRRMPEVRVPGYFSLWPTTMKDDWERLYDRLHGRTTLGSPMPPEVTFHEEVMAWLRVLERREQQLVWMRANRVPWKILVEEFGRSKPTLWRELRRSLDGIACHLVKSNQVGDIVQSIPASKKRLDGFKEVPNFCIDRRPDS